MLNSKYLSFMLQGYYASDHCLYFSQCKTTKKIVFQSLKKKLKNSTLLASLCWHCYLKKLINISQTVKVLIFNHWT